MNDSDLFPFPAPPLPRAGHSRAWWKSPASPSALAWAIARAAATHDGPVLAIAKDNHGAHQLEADLRTLLGRSEEHTSELQSLAYLVCRLLLEKKKKNNTN